MKILVTGGFGNIGIATVEESLRRGHSTTVFEVANHRTEELARRYRKRGVQVFFGDMRSLPDLSAAVAGQNAVIHLAAILPPTSDENPELCTAVNVGGTENLLSAIEAPGTTRASLVSVSSASVMGPTQRRDPPVHPGDPAVPTDIYSFSKIEAEALVSSSSLRYCILRLAAVMPTRLPMWASRNRAGLIFGMPLDARCEIVLDIDVAYALVEAAENLAGPGTMAGKTAFIAGGKSTGCQVRSRALVAGVLSPMGLGLPEETLFPTDLDSYYLDWYDTGEGQDILRYQRHTFDEWQATMRSQYQAIRPLLRFFRSPVMRIIEQQSPRTHERQGVGRSSLRSLV